MNKDLLTVSDLCQELDICKPTAYRLLKDNQIPHRKIGGKIVIHRASLEQFIAELTNPPSLTASTK